MNVASKFLLVLVLLLALLRFAAATITKDGNFATWLQTFLWSLVIALPAAVIFLHQKASGTGLFLAVVAMYIIAGVWMALMPTPGPLSASDFVTIFLTRPLVPLIALLLTIAITRPRRQLAAP